MGVEGICVGGEGRVGDVVYEVFKRSPGKRTVVSHKYRGVGGRKMGFRRGGFGVNKLFNRCSHRENKLKYTSLGEYSLRRSIRHCEGTKTLFMLAATSIIMDWELRGHRHDNVAAVEWRTATRKKVETDFPVAAALTRRKHQTRGRNGGSKYVGKYVQKRVEQTLNTIASGSAGTTEVKVHCLWEAQGSAGAAGGRVPTARQTCGVAPRSRIDCDESHRRSPTCKQGKGRRKERRKKKRRTREREREKKETTTKDRTYRNLGNNSTPAYASSFHATRRTAG